MKMKNIVQTYRTVENIFSCPICSSKMEIQEPASIICKNGHCYDLSKDGYINFLPKQKISMYSEELFGERRKVYEAGYYTLLVEEVGRMIQSIRKERRIRVIDAGCGEGYYDCWLQENLEDIELYAFDNMKKAIRMGAKKNKNIYWFVGNLAAIPLCSEQMDMVLEIFSPANYSEFRRIIKADGYILKVLPGAQYLKELRACIKGQTTSLYCPNPVENYFCSKMNLVDRIHLIYQKEVSIDILNSFLKMTPLMFGESALDIDITGIKALTFDFILLLGRK